MPRSLRRESAAETAADRAESPALPAGAPGWITQELIAQTIDTWQPYYTESLTAQDALEILLNVTQAFEHLER